MNSVAAALPVSREEANRLAEQCARVLRERYGARRVIPFGSAIGRAPWHSRSDLDLAVEGLPPGAYLQALNTLAEELPGLLAALETALAAFLQSLPETS